MKKAIPNPRAFRVHARHTGRHPARVVTGATFEAALIAYVEDFPLISPEETEISIVVQDIDSGREHCFRVNLATGETNPCG